MINKEEVVLPAILEAVLFAAAKPLSLEYLAEVLETNIDTVMTSLDYYETELIAHERGLRLNKTAVGVELVSAPEFSEYIVKIREKKEMLTKAALETLSVIAFKQPITRAEVEEVRGVNSDKVIKQLLDKELITDLGRKEGLGRPVLYGTTEKFLHSVGAKSLEEIKDELHINSNLDAQNLVEVRGE